MYLSISVLSALLATTALAAPSVSTNARTRLARRDARLARRDELNENWAGAMVNSLESGETIESVSTSFTIPTPDVPADVDETTGTDFTTSAWVGIDGTEDACNGLWQAGVDFTVETTGERSYYAWYEWYPAGTQVFDIGDLSPGNVINVTVSAASTTEGTATIENVSTGKTVSKTVTSTDTLCLASAEWIIEDVSFDTDTAGFANVGTFTFENTVAKTNKRTLGPKGSNIMDIEDDTNTQLTTTTVTSDTVVVKTV